MSKNSPDSRRLLSRHRPTGYTLVEVLIAVSVMAILAAAAIPSFEPDAASSLQSFAQLVSADLQRARDLAVSNNSTYRITFEAAANRFYLSHAGTNTALDTLPATVFRTMDDTATRHYTDLDDVPQLGADVRIAAVEARRSTAAPVTVVEFGPLGATTETADTVVWLSSGATNKLYAGIGVNAVTGIASIEPITAAAPSTATGS